VRNSFDLIVIGAGALGTFHAYHAARRGLNVLLLERDQYPVNATVRNFGQAVPSGLASDWFEYGRRTTEIYKEIQNEFDISVRNNGSVYIASDEAEQNIIHELKAIMDNRGYACELLTTATCLEKWPAFKKDYCKEALFFPQEISVEPEKMIYRLLEFCKHKFPHLTFQPDTTVVSCDTSGNGVSVATSEGHRYSADRVILCNGHEFKLLFADLFKKSGIVVSKLQMMRTHPLPSLAMEGNILTGLTIRRYESFGECPSFASLRAPQEHIELKKWGIHILLKKATDGSVILGDSHEYAEVNCMNDLGFSINNYINELMLQEAEKIVSFNVRNIAATWAGFYSQHPDKNIVEYDIEGRIQVRTAIGGKGMTSSAGYAEKNIQQIFDLS
jgi:FAD dependent oxidoreductase TIGR03364